MTSQIKGVSDIESFAASPVPACYRVNIFFEARRYMIGDGGPMVAFAWRQPGDRFTQVVYQRTLGL